MLSGLLETQRALLTLVVFCATFFVSLSLGRLLKRRAGVRLGIFFQLLSLTLAFYVALQLYGFQPPWRGHIGALLVLLGAIFLVSLLDRFLWDFYFERSRQTVIPKFLREVVALIVFLIALLIVLSVGYHADKQLGRVLAGSGIAAIVLALAAQNLLGGMIAGMSLQISRPYKLGDWLQVAERFAEVMEINWRSTRLRTNDGIYLDIPNNEIIRQTIVNLHYPTSLHAMRITLGVDYKVPPNRVKDLLLLATQHAEGVVHDPGPKVFLKDFGESAITYEIKFWMNNHALFNEVWDAIHTNIWYEFKRHNVTIPFPIRTLQLDRKPKGPANDAHAEARAVLREQALFSCLSEEQIDELLRKAQLKHYGRGERVIEEGADGSSMFVLLRGDAQVSVAGNGAAIRVGVLRAGDCFGEMSLLTGERRTATVRAEGDCDVLEIGKKTMGRLLRDAPDCLDQLSGLLAERRLETEGIVKDAAQQSADHERKQREYKAGFVARLHSIFEL